MARLVNPHILFYIRAQDEGAPDETPPRNPTLQEYRLEYDLGSYPAAKLEKLLGKVGEAVQKWVEQNPPHGS